MSSLRVLAMSLENIIDKLFVESDKRREYIGASAVGNPCLRAIQFYWLHLQGRVEKPAFEPRILRIFDRGNVYEEQIRKWMLASGFVFETDDTKLQFSDLDDKFKGHVDGVLLEGPLNLDYPVLWECKCLNDKNSIKLEQQGLKTCKPGYYAQVQLYMYYLELKSCLFTWISADTMKIYDEVVVFDKAFAKDLIDNVALVLEYTGKNKFLPRNQDKFRCRYCDYEKVCFTGEA